MTGSEGARDPASTGAQHAGHCPLGIEGLVEAEEVGRGGFAVVYRAHQTSLDRQVAVKVLCARLDVAGRARFAREGFVLGNLSGHPNIVTVYGTGLTADDRPYITMDYLPRGTLAQRLRRHGPLPWPEAVRIGVKIAGALESAHRANTLHRDVKPENVLLSNYGEPLLADFGIARVQGLFETAGGQFLGSILYTAPELLEGQAASAASDLYSLAATIFSLLTGDPPFPTRPDEPFAALYVRIVTRPPPDLPADLPAALRALLRRALHKNPVDRQSSVGAFAAALQHLEGARGLPPTQMVVGPDPSTVVPLPSAARRRVHSMGPKHGCTACEATPDESVRILDGVNAPGTARRPRRARAGNLTGRLSAAVWPIRRSKNAD